ncbi:MAG: PEGA domain-containing protein [Spirochaetales bacterium]|nr:PEGA domain-containing protein [Spirochaetales bacterium]
MSKTKIFFSILVLFLLCSTGLFAIDYIVRIEANVTDADVYIDGKFVGQTPISLSLSRGAHNLRLSKAGFQDYNVRINVTRKTSYKYNMKKSGEAINTPVPIEPTSGVFTQFKLRIDANIRGATVFIDNVQRGRTPFTMLIPVGTYNLRVTAPGYTDYNERIAISADSNFNITLEESVKYYTLQVTANVKGARLYINGHDSGKTPVSLNLAAGDYQIRVSYKNFADFEQVIRLDHDMRINAELRSSLAQLKIIIPKDILDNRKNAIRQVYIYIDGKRYVNKLDFDLESGVHKIRILSGGLSVEASFNFEGGQVYKITPRLTLDVE